MASVSRLSLAYPSGGREPRGIDVPWQFGGTPQHSTVDAGVMLTQHVRAGWREGLHTSVLALDIEQFYLSVNHSLLQAILAKLRFAIPLISFMSSYLAGRTTWLSFSGQLSPEYQASTGLGQGSSLSPVLANLYIAPLLRSIAPEVFSHGKSGLLFFVDDGVLIASSPSMEDNVKSLATTYCRIDDGLKALGLKIGHDKTEFIHFPRRMWSIADRNALILPFIRLHDRPYKD